MGQARHETTNAEASRSNAAIGLAGFAVILFFLAEAIGQEWLFPVSGVVGAAAVFAGWTAGRPRPAGKPLAAIIVGSLVVLAILSWIVWAAATGNF